MTEYYELEPARAKSRSDEKLEELWGNPEYVAEEKLDGWRYLLHFGLHLKRPYLTGRRTSKETGLLSEKGLNAPMIAPRSDLKIGYTVLDGEIMPPVTAGFRDIAAIMNSDPDKAAEEIKRLGEPRYFVFDILYCEDRDVRTLSYLERRSLMIDIVKRCDNPLITAIQAGPCDRAFYESIVDAGGEGVIIKYIAGEYGEEWFKVKRYSTLDVVITGFTDAKFGRTGKYMGQIGAALVSVYGSDGSLIEVGRVSGMDDAMRYDMSQNQREWTGRVIEVAAQEFSKTRLRHPRFKRVRPDADPKHCTFEKMLSDLRVGRKVEAEAVVKGEQQEWKF